MSVTGIEIAEIASAETLGGTLFRRRFGQEPPTFPHHVVAYARDGGGTPAVALCYVHFTPMGSVLLGGGACVDHRALRRLAPDVRNALHAQGGLYRTTLEWAVAHFAHDHDAIFGYCGDRLAERIDLAAGFVRSGHPHLLVRWLREVEIARQQELIATVHALGAF